MTKQIIQISDSFIFKNNQLLLSRKCKLEIRYLKIKNNSRGYRVNNLQIAKVQNFKLLEQKVQRFDQSLHKHNLFYLNKEVTYTNAHDSRIDLLIDIRIQKQIQKRFFNSNNKYKIQDLIKGRVLKKGYVEDVQISQELRKKLFKIKKKNRLYKKYQIYKQIYFYFKKTLIQNKTKLLGGGGCCSSGIQKSDLNQISTQNNSEFLIQNNSENQELLINVQSWKNQETLIQNISKNNKFEINHKNWTNQEIITRSILENNQLTIQSNLIEQCILNELIDNEDQVNAYKLEIQDLFETYLILETTRISQKSDLKQEKFEKMLQELESTLTVYEIDIPNMELVFYTTMLTNLNKLNHKFDQNQQKEIIEFINRILNFSKNKETYSEIVLKANAIRKFINQFYKKKELFGLKYSIEIWLKKIEQFGDRFIQISEDVSSEILFYVKIFFQIYKTQNQKDEIIITLIRINYLLEKFQKENSKQDKEVYHKFSNNLIKANFDEFLSELMQKSDLLDNKVFLLWRIENQNYRYITLSILININIIFTFTTQNTQNQEYLLDFLLNKYLIGKQLAIKVLFDKIPFIVQYVQKNIMNETFNKRMLNFDKQRKLKLLPYIENINDYEKSIKSLNDILKVISDNAIEKWERDIKKRQRQNLAKKDDILLEVKDLYINQMITYQKGNQIFYKVIQQNITRKEYTTNEQNALQDILQIFLNPNYSYKLKQFNNSTSLSPIQQKCKFLFSCFQFQSGDDSRSENNQNEQLFKEQSKQCYILGILAEGGTGKSMLMKKIETFLIEKLSKLNTETETSNYLPLLIKCNSLDSKNPSLEDYLLRYGGINEDQLQNLKQNDRNKLILLDGYDEYTGEYFVIYTKLNLSLWKNTKVIVTTRKEKLSEEDACKYFSKQNERGVRDEMSYSLVQLEEFTTNDIHEYAQRYFKQERKTDKINEIDKDLNNLSDCLTNIELEKLLHLPINLYLFTRMLVHLSEKEVSNLKNKVSDQIGIQDMFFDDQFDREAQSYLDSHVHSDELKKDLEFRKCLKNSYFEYFQTLAMRMLENRSVKSNYLQVEKEKINFNIQQSKILSILNMQQVSIFLEKIKNYINSKIVTRSKEEVAINQENKDLSKIKYLIEFRHKSLFEYFAARAMKYDFDIHGDNIHKMSIEQLKEFNINKASIMNGGQNQSEQQILLKLFKMIQTQVDSYEFYSSYHLQEIEKNSRYIQYIKKSTIKRNTDISLIDIGASNMLSALFLSKYLYSKLELRYSSLSKFYTSCQKSDQISFDYCNLQNSFLKNLHLNYDSCNIQFATFDNYQKVFGTQNIFSFNHIIWDKSNMLYSITQSGFINVFKIENQNKIVLQKSKQLSQTPLSSILIINNDALLVSSQYSLLLIDSVSFELLKSYKFNRDILRIGMIKENILVILKDYNIFHGSFKFGFRNTNIIGDGCVYNKSKQILLVHLYGELSLYNTEENFMFIKRISGHDYMGINSVVFSADGKYLATGSRDMICQIWNAEKNFELINTIQGHSESIISVAFSPDQKYLATGSSDKTCKIWNAQKGFQLINTIQGHTEGIISVAFSEDGKYIATGSEDKTCKIWNAEKGFELINRIQGHTSFIDSVAFSTDGKYLATGSSDNTCQIWDAERGFEIINTILGHAVAFSTDGKYLATGSSDNTCQIWNAEKGFELINTIQGHTEDIFSVAFSADGKYLATGSKDKTCKIWNEEKGFVLINTIQGHTSEISSIAFSADGKYIVTGSYDKTCKIWNAEKGFELINTIQSHTDQIQSVAFSADGKYLATGSKDYTCKIWNAEKGFELINTIQVNTYFVNSVAFSSDGKILATVSSDKTYVWNAEKNFELINTIQGHDLLITRVAFSADGKYLATVSSDQTFTIWDVENIFELINTIQGQTTQINSVAFSSDGKYLAAGSDDKTCKIQNAEKGFELINIIQCHTDSIICVAFSADGKYLATGSEDKTCKIWNAAKGFELINTIQGHSKALYSVAFSADGKILATGSSDKTCKIWNAEKGFELINTIQGHTWIISSIVFSADGKYLATGSWDKTCKIWNAEKNFELINTTQDHSKALYSVTFSTNGKYLATGSEDNTCKLWNAEKGFELINTFQGHTGRICSVNFSSDGKYLATGSSDSTCKIWNVEEGFELITTISCDSTLIISFVFSEDGKYLATGSEDKAPCKIWNAEKGICSLKEMKIFENMFIL